MGISTNSKIEKPRRSPLSKEKFLEGNRSRFTLIFMTAMFVIMGCEVKWHVGSAAYLSFLTFLGSFYLGGATLSAWVSANKTQTVNENVTMVQTSTKNDNVQVSVQTTNDENVKIDKDVTQTINENININEYIKEEGVDAPAMKPFGAQAVGDEEEGEHNDFER